MDTEEHEANKTSWRNERNQWETERNSEEKDKPDRKYLREKKLCGLFLGRVEEEKETIVDGWQH